MKLKQGIIAIVVIIGFSLSSIAQTTHTITLNVDTGKITRSTVNSYSNFGQSSSISNEDFTVEVNLGDIVKWVGVSSSNPNDVVKIESIKHRRGKKVFDAGELTGGNSGVVSGRVKNGSAGDYEKYDIKFRIYYNGTNKSKQFKIDPKIVIKR